MWIIVQISNDTERFVASETSHPSKHLVSYLQQLVELSAKFVELSLSHNGKRLEAKYSRLFNLGKMSCFNQHNAVQ